MEFFNNSGDDNSNVLLRIKPISEINSTPKQCAGETVSTSIHSKYGEARQQDNTEDKTVENVIVKSGSVDEDGAITSSVVGGIKANLNERITSKRKHSNALQDNAASSGGSDDITIEPCEQDEPSSSATSSKRRKSSEENDDDDGTVDIVAENIKIKNEPLSNANDDDNGSSKGSPTYKIKPAVKVEVADATSSTTRPSCRFGIRCYRANPVHRNEEAHPGDSDYKRPNYPLPPLGTPNCPFGNRCYRRNPTHFQQYTHPADTDFEKNYKQRLRRRLQQQNTRYDCGSGNSSEDDDPFNDDDEADSEYAPNTQELNEESDEEPTTQEYDDEDI